MLVGFLAANRELDIKPRTALQLASLFGFMFAA
jgi:hypothetical protein